MVFCISLFFLFSVFVLSSFLLCKDVVGSWKLTWKLSWILKSTSSNIRLPTDLQNGEAQGRVSWFTQNLLGGFKCCRITDILLRLGVTRTA